MDATLLRRAFRSLSKELHPDTTSLPKADAARRFQEVCEAYEFLSDPLSRKAYDESLDALNSGGNSRVNEKFVVAKEEGHNTRAMEVRRSFSGGELFSLLSLVVALLFSLLLAIGFAFTQGREWQSRPSWLVVDSSPGTVMAEYEFNVSTPVISNPIKSTFSRSFRGLAE